MSQDYLDKLIEKDKAGTQIQSIPLHDTELRGITIDDPITVEGNPINFSTKNEQNAIQTVIDLDPIQDLHGYSKPWVGGAGKNLLPMTVDGLKSVNTNGSWSGNSYIYNGVTFTILTDSDNNVIGIKVNGTVQSTSSLSILYITSTISNIITLNGTYICNGCPTGGSNNTYNIRLGKGSGDSYLANDLGSGTTFSTSNEIITVRFHIEPGTTVNNLMFYPMIRLSTETDATFEPYTNICPILPHEEIKIGGCGNNILPKDYELTDRNGITHSVNDDGTFILTGTTTSKPYYAYIRSINNPLPVEYGQNYVASFLKNGTLMPNISKVNARVVKVKNGVQGSNMNANNGIVSFTVDDSFDSIFIYINAEDTGIDMSGTYAIQLEVGTSNTTYEPYTLSNSLTLTLPENVYGGTLNLETGELRVDRGFVDLGSLTWAYNTSPVNYFSSYISGKQYAFDNLICSDYMTSSEASVVNQENYSIRGSLSAEAIIIKDPRYNNANDFKAAMAGVTSAYELSTPYTLHLTPSQLKLFKDVNNLNSSDYTTLTVTYHSNSMATLTPATDTTDGLLSAMDKHKLNTYDIADIGSDDGVTVEDNPLMITTRSDQHALSTKVSLAPIQDLHGFSKPWVGGAGKNKLILTTEYLKSINTSGTWSNDVYTSNSATFTLITDSDNNVLGIKVNGTPSTATTFSLMRNDGLKDTLDNSTAYILSGCSGGSDSTYYIYGYHINNSTSGVTLANGETTFTWLDATTDANITIQVKSGYNAQNIIFYPMIRLATESNPTFEPYTNICSISGLDEIDILGCGKNLCSKTISGCNISPNGVIGTEVNYDMQVAYLKKNVTYTMTTDDVNGFVGGYFSSEPSKGSTAIGKTRIIQASKTITPTIDCWVAFRTSANYTTPQIEKGNQPTTFEPYTKSNDFSISLPETVYGGELDLESGELVMNYGIKTYSGASGENWAITGSAYAYINVPDAKSVTSSSEIFNAISNEYEVRSLNNVQTVNPYNGLALATNNNMIIYSEGKSNNLSTWTTYLTSNNLEVCYKLATPYTIHLTPEQLTLFKDINYISTNAKFISVTYREGKLAVNSPATDTKDGLLSAMDKRALDRTEEIVEGNPIQFETESAQVAKSTIVDLEPIQDLHGYSKPWVGGAGKNLLSMTVEGIKNANTSGTWNANEYTHLGVKYTILADTDNNVIGIKLSGLSTEDWSQMILGYFSVTNGTRYIANGLTDTGVRIDLAGIDSFTITTNGDSGWNASGTGSNTAKLVVRNSGTSVNCTVYPMMRLGTETDSSFAPYTNIASISGRSEVDILGCGKNLFDKSKAVENYRVITANGELEGIGAGWHASDYTGVENNTTYIMNFVYYSSANFGMAYYDKNKVYISGEKQRRKEGDTSFTFTTPNNCKYIRFTMNDITNIDGVQLEKGSIVTTYEPYRSSTFLQIQLGQTVYGGQIDVENGVLVVDRGYKLFDGTETWSVLNYGHVATQISNMKSGTNQDGICSILETGNSSGQMQFGSGSNFIYIMNASGVYGIDTNEKAQSFTNGMQICYPLATPTTISLTPEQVKLLQGVNTITTNADNITLTYRNGSVATLNDLESLYAKLKAYIDSLHSS